MTYGSLVNSLSEASDKEWAVGDGATILMFSDRHAATVVEAGPKRIVIQRDIAKRTDDNGMSESQTYEFTPDPTAPKIAYTLRKNGRWVREGDPLRGGETLGRGRSSYYDFTR